jgi:hypothetical protein
MKRRLPPLQRLLELARQDAKRRPRPAAAADAAEVCRIAQRALAALPGRAEVESAPLPKDQLRYRSAGWQPAVSRIGNARGPVRWADVFERLCWRAAGATAAVCLALLLLHRPAPEPDVSALFLDWPAETGELF